MAWRKEIGVAGLGALLGDIHPMGADPPAGHTLQCAKSYVSQLGRRLLFHSGMSLNIYRYGLASKREGERGGASLPRIALHVARESQIHWKQQMARKTWALWLWFPNFTYYYSVFCWPHNMLRHLTGDALGVIRGTFDWFIWRAFWSLLTSLPWGKNKTYFFMV